MATLNLEKIRNVDIITLAKDLGFKQDKYDKKEYRRDDLKVSIDEKRGRFNSFVNEGVKGAGSIDFVMKTENLRFKDAAQKINDMYSIDKVSIQRDNIQRDNSAQKAGNADNNNTVKDNIQKDNAKDSAQNVVFKDYKAEIEKEPESKTLIMPVKAENNDKVKEYLTESRAIEPKTAKALVEKGYIYQDKQNNAVFICKDTDGKITGAERKGTDGKFTGMAAGSDKNGGAFTLKLNDSKQSLVLTESALDAISYCALNKTENATVISTAGLTPNITTAMSNIIEKNGTKNIKIGFDNDKPGQENAEKLKTALQEKYHDINVEIKIPERGKDFNENLQLDKAEIEKTANDFIEKLDKYIESQKEKAQEPEYKNPYESIDKDNDDYIER